MDIHRIGRYIAMKRREAGMTQAELSQRLHVTRQAVSKWESGKSIPDTATLLSLSNLFDLTVEELLNGGDLPAPAAAEPSLPPTMVPGVPSPSCSPSEPAAYDFGGQPAVSRPGSGAARHPSPGGLAALGPGAARNGGGGGDSPGQSLSVQLHLLQQDRGSPFYRAGELRRPAAGTADAAGDP